MDKKRIRYLYIFNGAMRNLNGFFKMIEDRKDAEDHIFYLPRNDDIKIYVPELNEHDNIIYLGKKSFFRELIFEYRLFQRCDHIIIHGMFFGVKPLITLLTSKKFLKRLSWIEWTGDVFIWKREGHSLKDRFINWINQKIREKIKLIVMSAPTDKERFESEFDISNKTILYIPFPSNRNAVAELEETRPQKQKTDGSVWIQIGHNGYRFHHHIKILDMLERFREENIKLIIPMAYGSTGLNGQYGGANYIKSVNRFAKLIYKDKAIPYSKSIPLKKYTQFLWNIDIAVFAMERLAGASNVFMLLYMGKKVFFPGDSPHFKFFREQGFDVYDTNKIPQMSFEEFIRPVQNHDISWLKNVYDNKTTIQRWNSFYEELNKM